MPLEILNAVLTLPFSRLGLAQDLGAGSLRASEVRVDVIDVHDHAVHDKGVSSHCRASAQACAWRRGPWYASEGWPTSTVAPSISRTTSVTVPAPLWKRSISRKPNTFVIQSAARAASSYASIGMTRCSAIVGLLRAFASNDALAPRSKRGHDARVTDAVVEVRDLRKTFRV